MLLFKRSQLRFLQPLIFGLLFWLFAGAAQSQVLHPIPTTQSTRRGNVRVLGQPCKNSYVVAIPAYDPIILDRVQRYVPSAFLTHSRLGWYVQAGSFRSRLPAESLSRRLRKRDFDARVTYLPVQCRRSLLRY